MLHSRRHIDMADYFQSRTTKWNEIQDEHSENGPPQNPLLLFCDLILKYEKYKPHKEEMNDSAYSPASSERTNDSYSSESDSSFNDSKYLTEEGQPSGDAESDSWDLITCHCMKPFRGRPMIECTLCGTWVHMSCAKVRPNNIPEVFICQFCREPKDNKRRSERIRSDDRRLFN